MFAADARKHTPGKNAEKENFSMRILVCDDDAAFAGQLAEKIEAIVKPQMPRSTVDCAHRCSAAACFAAGKIRSGFFGY